MASARPRPARSDAATAQPSWSVCWCARVWWRSGAASLTQRREARRARPEDGAAAADTAGAPDAGRESARDLRVALRGKTTTQQPTDPALLHRGPAAVYAVRALQITAQTPVPSRRPWERIARHHKTRPAACRRRQVRGTAQGPLLTRPDSTRCTPDTSARRRGQVLLSGASRINRWGVGGTKQHQHQPMSKWRVGRRGARAENHVGRGPSAARAPARGGGRPRRWAAPRRAPVRPGGRAVGVRSPRRASWRAGWRGWPP